MVGNFTVIIISGGTYNDDEGLVNKGGCMPCPTRKYCPEGMSSTGYDCPAGFYCTGGQASGNQNACPKGTYSNATGLNGKSYFFFQPLFIHSFIVYNEV